MGRQFSFVILQSCSGPREKYFLLHSLSSRCVRFCTVQTIEQVILNLDYHGILVNIIFRSCKLWVSCGNVLKTCHITIKVPWFSIAVHTTIFFIERRLCCDVVLYFGDLTMVSQNLFNFILAIFLLVFTTVKIRVGKFIAFKHLRCDSYIVVLNNPGMICRS